MGTNPTRLHIVQKPCKRNHTDKNGNAVRFKVGTCWACYKGYPDGPYNEDFSALDVKVYAKKKYETDAERKAAHVRDQAKWYSKNKDKVSAYQKKYSEKPDIKAKRSAAAAKKYEEDRDAILAKNKAYYYRRKNALDNNASREL